MKVLVTGHKGFIGTHLVATLTSLGIECRGFDNREWKYADVRKLENLLVASHEMEIGEDDVVIHLAALTGVRDGELHPSDYIETNIVGTQNVIEMCRIRKVKHLISFSSSSVLGNQIPPNDETAPLSPVSVYGHTKAFAEYLVQRSGLNASIVRPFTVYGENGRVNQVFHRWAESYVENKTVPFYGDGTTKRGYTYVGDLVDGVLAILQRVDSLKGVNVFHFGGKEVISLEYLWGLFSEIYPDAQRQMLERPNADVVENWADVSRAMTMLNWSPKTPFREKAIELFKQEVDYLIR